ncbi:MAG: Eco29kI family restriction endonuclease [Polaromonas sp.]|nr:Eco29kI family restriction endonuclease [Polaromonas sp.]
MSGNVIPFNPLDKKNLGASVAEAMLGRPVVPLGDIGAFTGAGLYAIYYTGNFPAYEKLSEHNRKNQFLAPIYIGKAVPAGSRKGGSLAPVSLSRVLARRLAEHAESINQTSNLKLADFHCRFLVVDEIWIPLGESLLISKFTPVWNSLIDGFGNHNPGSGRFLGMRPRWDVLHPGRSWAERCAVRPETAAEVQRDVKTYLRTATFTDDQTLIRPNPSQPG